MYKLAKIKEYRTFFKGKGNVIFSKKCTSGLREGACWPCRLSWAEVWDEARSDQSLKEANGALCGTGKRTGNAQSRTVFCWHQKLSTATGRLRDRMVGGPALSPLEQSGEKLEAESSLQVVTWVWFSDSQISFARLAPCKHKNGLLTAKFLRTNKIIII